MNTAVREAADVYVQRGRPVLNTLAGSSSPLETVTAQDFERRNFDFLGLKSTDVRMALALGRLRRAQGNLTEARAFAQIGLSRIGKAQALRHQLEELCTG
jgi:hypothetical protein